MTNDPGFRPPPDPMDRLWRHPSELAITPETQRPRSLVRAGAAVVSLGVVAALLVVILTRNAPTTGRQLLTTRLWNTPTLSNGTVALDTEHPVRVTGVAVGEGIVLTSAAALGSSRTVRVNGTPAAVVAVDRATDIAIIRTDLMLTPAVLAPASGVRPGDRIVLATLATATDGYVAATNASVVDTHSGEMSVGMLRTTILAHPAHGGAPVFSERGVVVGIASAHSLNGYDVVIPIDTARAVLDQLRRNGAIRHGSIGAQIIDDQREIRVRSVTPDSPADRADLRLGDVIVAVDGQPESSADALAVRIRDAVPGTQLTLSCNRKGQRLPITVIVGTT